MSRSLTRPVTHLHASRGSMNTIADADLARLQKEIAHTMAAVRNRLDDLDLRLEDMSDADIIAFVATYVRG